ncbi:MAG: recombinase zinc beta ribbon domain-containing protein [Magnetococcales bacterium]|nr:recombinase zinc beta ribbon domain-containing protein [Magnetococcales bacterium]
MPSEAENVRHIFRRFQECGFATLLIQELAEAGINAKNGQPLDKCYLYRMLANRLYVGEIVLGEEVFPGEHQAIIDRDLWDQVQAEMAAKVRRQGKNRIHPPALLKGVIRCRHCGRAMSPSLISKDGRQYRYYLCQTAIKTGHNACSLRSVAAGEIEAVVIGQVRTMLRSPEMVVKTWQAGNEQEYGLQEREIVPALRRLDPVWEELFPVEQQRLVNLLIDAVEVSKGDVQVHLRAAGLDTLARGLNEIGNQTEAAA